MNKTVHYEMDLNQLPRLTEKQKAELNALATMLDSEIDYSDIASLDETFWQNAVQNPLFAK